MHQSQARHLWNKCGHQILSKSVQAFISYPSETKVWEMELQKGQSLTSVTLKSRSRSTCFSSSLCNVLSYDNVKFKWNPNKRHEQNGQKPQKRSKFDLCLTSVTLKSRSRSTILMPVLPHALRNIYVKFDRNPNERHEENGQKPQKRSKFDLCDLEK